MLPLSTILIFDFWKCSTMWLVFFGGMGRGLILLLWGLLSFRFVFFIS